MTHNEFKVDVEVEIWTPVRVSLNGDKCSKTSLEGPSDTSLPHTQYQIEMLENMCLQSQHKRRIESGPALRDVHRIRPEESTSPCESLPTPYPLMLLQICGEQLYLVRQSSVPSTNCSLFGIVKNHILDP